ncbi:MAG: hypothetical protein U0441_00875 [Polyangiaceae bacterium]
MSFVERLAKSLRIPLDHADDARFEVMEWFSIPFDRGRPAALR